MPALLGLVLLAAPARAQGQYAFTTNAGAITITGYSGDGGAVSIPAAIAGLPVTRIGDYAFAYCANLAGVTIPDSVVSLDDGAFSGCGSLAGVTIPGSVTNLGEGAFEDCASLAGVTIPGSVARIGDAAFQNCPSLTNVIIANGVTAIGNEVFEGCASLAGVTIPGSVTSLGIFAFSGCASLASVTIPGSVTSLGGYAFNNCASLASVCLAGNAPAADASVFAADNSATAYYLPGAAGWSSNFGGIPALLWNPAIQAGGAGFGLHGGEFGFFITGTANLAIVVEASDDLGSPVWSPLQTVTLTNGSFYFSEPARTNSGGRFYRLRSP